MTHQEAAKMLTVALGIDAYVIALVGTVKMAFSRDDEVHDTAWALTFCLLMLPFALYGWLT